MTPAAVLLAMAVGAAAQQPTAAAHSDDVFPFPHALVWMGLPKAADIWSTGYCIEQNKACAEANPIQRSAEQRAALAGAAVVLSAWAVYEIENHPRLRDHRNWRRVPRYAWAALHLAAFVNNAYNARRK